MLKNMEVLLYTNFNNIYLNILRPIFFSVNNLPFVDKYHSDIVTGYLFIISSAA